MIARNIALTVLVGGALALILRKQITSTWTPMQIAGICLLTLGFVLWTMARFQLGRSFTVTAQAKRLVSWGLYSRIRNPIYLFGSCVIIGVILAVGHPVYLLIFVLIIPLQIWRARKEASVLEAKFGEQYRLYRASTWF